MSDLSRVTLRDLCDLIDNQVCDIRALKSGELVALITVQESKLAREWLRDPQTAADDGRRQVQDFLARPEVDAALALLTEHYGMFADRLRAAVVAIEAGTPLPDGGARVLALMREAEAARAVA